MKQIAFYITMILLFAACQNKKNSSSGGIETPPENTLLPLKGAFNARDLGGIETKDGHTIKWKKVFRSDELGNLTEQDWEYLQKIPLVSIVDFRSSTEIDTSPDKAPSSIASYPLSINPGNLTVTDYNFWMDKDFDAEDFMKNLNLQLVSDSVSIGQYREFFRILQQPESVPLLFHCTAGKDRTGMGAALFLAALGVDEETIYSNYLESNKNLEGKYAKMLEEHPEAEKMFGVQRSYLETGLSYVKETYGSIENYLTEVLAVDIDKLKELYLSEKE